MKRNVAFIAAVVVLTWMARAQGLSSGATGNTKAVLDQAADTMGALNMKTIEFLSSGSYYFPGQPYLPYDPLPRFEVKSFRYVADYTTPGSYEERIRVQAMNPPHGGNPQPLREEREIGYLNGDYAWGLQVGGTSPLPLTPPRLNRETIGLNWDVVELRQINLLETPHGFVIAALKNPAATVKEQILDGKRYRVVSFPRGKTRIDGYINDENLVERVETWMAHPLMGDMSIESSYSGYRDWGGVKFPTKWIQKWYRQVVVDYTISDVTPNVAIDLRVPDAIRNAPVPPAATIRTRKEGDGIYGIGGGNATTIAIEFKDFIVAIEAGTNQERSIAVLAEIKRLFPAKPLRYLVNTHAHFNDHAAGIRPYAAEGVTIITQQGNKKWFDEVALKGTWTIKPDKLSQMNITPVVEGVEEKRVITDGSRQLVLYHLGENPHTASMLVAYLPAEKIIMEADVYATTETGLNMFDPFEPSPDRPPDYPCSAGLQEGCAAKAMLELVQREKLSVEHILPVHGPTVTWDSFLKYMGRSRGAKAKS